MSAMLCSIGSRSSILTFPCLLLFAVLSLGFSQQADPLLAHDLLAVLHARNGTELEKVKVQNPSEYVIVVARAYRAHQLGLPKSEKKLFLVLPRSSDQASRLQSVASLNSEHGRKELVGLYENYYKTVFKLASKHPQYIHRLFAIAANFGGELDASEQEWFCDLLHDLFEDIPREYLRALADESKYRTMPLTCAAGCIDTQ